MEKLLDITLNILQTSKYEKFIIISNYDKHDIKNKKYSTFTFSEIIVKIDTVNSASCRDITTTGYVSSKKDYNGLEMWEKDKTFIKETLPTVYLCGPNLTGFFIKDLPKEIADLVALHKVKAKLKKAA